VAGDPSFNVTPGQTVTENGPISDGATPGMVEVIGGGTLVLGNASNSYSGGTTVTGNSTLSINNDHELGNASGALTLGDATSGGTLVTTASVTSARDVTLGAGGGAVNVASGTVTNLSGVVTGGGLTKSGTGTLILSGSNGYTGNTTVSGGTLSISKDANLGNGGTLALENGTALDFTAGGSYGAHPITLAGNTSFNVASGRAVTESGLISNGATPGTLVVTGGGTLQLSNPLPILVSAPLPEMTPEKVFVLPISLMVASPGRRAIPAGRR